MITRATPVGLSRKYKNRFRIKSYGGEISEDLVDHIRPTLRRKPGVILTHIGTNAITNDNCSSLQRNLNKICKVVTELSPSTRIVLSTIILRHDKNKINGKVKRGN